MNFKSINNSMQGVNLYTLNKAGKATTKLAMNAEQEQQNFKLGKKVHQ